jgi:hypothetical protein
MPCRHTCGMSRPGASDKHPKEEALDMSGTRSWLRDRRPLCGRVSRPCRAAFSDGPGRWLAAGGPEFPADEEQLRIPIWWSWPGSSSAQIWRRSWPPAWSCRHPRIYERFKTLVPGFSGHDAEFLGQLRRAVSFDVDRLPFRFPGPALFVLGRQDTSVGYRGALGLIDQYPRAQRWLSWIAPATRSPGSRKSCSKACSTTGSRASRRAVRPAH